MNAEQEERWVGVVGFEGLYTISNTGKVFSLKRQRELKPSRSSNGYLKVTLYNNGKAYTRYLHRMVAEAFISQPYDCDDVEIIDGWFDHVYVGNLRWTPRRRVNQTTGYEARTILQYAQNGRLIESYDSMSELLLHNPKYKRCTLYNALNGRRDTAYGYVWRYRPKWDEFTAIHGE